MHRNARQTIGELTSRQSFSRLHPEQRAGFRYIHQKAAALKQPRSLPKEHLQELNNLTQEIIGRTGDGEKLGWHHTQKLRGEEKRLAQAVKDGQRRVSMAQEDFNALGPEEDDVSVAADTGVLPGTFVEVRRCVLSQFYGVPSPYYPPQKQYHYTRNYPWRIIHLRKINDYISLLLGRNLDSFEG